MATEEDCSCADTTEASNVTSLQSDNSYASNVNLQEPSSFPPPTQPPPLPPTCSSVNRDSGNGFQRFNCKTNEPSIAVTIKTTRESSGTNLMFIQVRDCKCHEIHSAVHHHGAPPEQCQLTGKAEESCKRDSPKDPSSTKQSACLYHARKTSSCYAVPLKCRSDKSNSRQSWYPSFKWRWPKKGYLERKNKAYEVKLKQKKCPYYAEPIMCCEISEGIPNKKKVVAPKLSAVKPPKNEEKNVEAVEKIDIYYFDHGNSAYYRTTDSPPILVTEKCAEKTDHAAIRFWAEIFGTIHIGTAFVTAFILQLVRFILYSIIRPLTVGILQMLADYFIKPLLSIVFNALIQPVLILFYNIATSFKDLCEPIAEAVGLFLREIAHLCAAIRVVEVKQGATTNAPSVACT